MSSSPSQAYDQLSRNYDRFVNWSNRLNFELPFLLSQLNSIQTSDLPLNILDAACGTGMHALALAQRGFQVSGADISPGMVEKSRENSRANMQKVDFQTAGFGALAATFGHDKFNAVLCLGNSLPHVTDWADLNSALQDFAHCLQPGGMLILQNRNFEAVLTSQERWMEPQSFQENGQEWLFIRFYDFRQDGLINFHILTLFKDVSGVWKQSVSTTQLLPLLRSDLLPSLAAAGFTSVALYGGLNGSPFVPESSGNLVIVAQKP